VGDGKATVYDPSSKDLPPPNMYAQGPSETTDNGIATDARVGPSRPSTTGSVGSAQETTGSAGSSDSTTEPPKDYLSTTGHLVKWVAKKGLKKGAETGVLLFPGGPLAVHPAGLNKEAAIDRFV
jgi:hypothetical protein